MKFLSLSQRTPVCYFTKVLSHNVPGFNNNFYHKKYYYTLIKETTLKCMILMTTFAIFWTVIWQFIPIFMFTFLFIWILLFFWNGLIYWGWWAFSKVFLLFFYFCIMYYCLPEKQAVFPLLTKIVYKYTYFNKF